MTKKQFIALADMIRRNPVLFPQETVKALAIFANSKIPFSNANAGLII